MSERPKTAADLVSRMSVSKTEMWYRCQFQFFQRYVLGSKKPPSAFLALGRATDSTADVFYKGKMESGEDLERKDVEELWEGEFLKEAGDVEDLGANERDSLRDKGVLAIGRWREKIAVPLQPTAIKTWFELLMEGDWTLVGEVDLVARPAREMHRPPIPCDTKMSGKRWNAKQAFSTMQPSIYGAALDHSDVDANTGLFQFHVSLLYDPTKKRKSTDPAQIVTRRVTDEEKTGALARVAMARRQIKTAFETGDFLPNRLCQSCTRRHCGWWRECESTWGPRVPD